jgi:predicted nucleotidyltransferase
MTNTSLDIAGKVDRRTVDTLQLVERTASALGIPYVVIGATARDLVLHHYYGARIQRATQDIDFAIQVADWSAFSALTEALEKEGYEATKMAHRFKSPTGGVVDIVPFGAVEDEQATIAWPPADDIKMTVLGLEEALATSVRVSLTEGTEPGIPVATPTGLTILKLIAWTERSPDLRIKDAQDIVYIIESHEHIPAVQDECYGDQDLMGSYEWDINLSAAEILGRNVRDVLQPRATELLSQLFDHGTGKLTVENLIEDSCTYPDTQMNRHDALIQAFIKGFREGSKHLQDGDKV